MNGWDEHGWDELWKKRIADDTGTMRNWKKFRFLLNELWQRPFFIPLEKLDIGCGDGLHAFALSRFCPQWRTRWTGIDSCARPIWKVQENKLNAYVADIYTYKSDKKFQLFLLLDTLEHIEDHNKLAESIKRLAAPEYFIFGNTPLYHQKDVPVFERPMSIQVIAQFLTEAGVPFQYHKVYGINYHPYMLFEAANFKFSDLTIYDVLFPETNINPSDPLTT